jgi:hypothetical protein
MNSYKEKYQGFTEVGRFEGGNLILLVKPDEQDRCGFEAVTLEFESCQIGYEDIWNDETE